MEILCYVIYGIGLIVTISWLFNIRHNTKTGQGVGGGIVNTTILFIISLVLIPLLKLSPFHLFWLFPVSMMLGLILSRLSHYFPFSLLSYPGHAFWRLICMGLNIKDCTHRGIYGMNYQEFGKLMDEIAHSENKKQM